MRVPTVRRGFGVAHDRGTTGAWRGGSASFTGAGCKSRLVCDKISPCVCVGVFMCCWRRSWVSWMFRTGCRATGRSVGVGQKRSGSLLYERGKPMYVSLWRVTTYIPELSVAGQLRCQLRFLLEIPISRYLHTHRKP